MAHYHRIDHIGVAATKGTGEWIYSYPTMEEATLALLGSFLRAATVYKGDADRMIGVSRSIQDDQGNIICLLAADKDNRFFLTAYPTPQTGTMITKLEALQGRRVKENEQIKRAKKWHVGSLRPDNTMSIEPILRWATDKYSEEVAGTLIPELHGQVTIEKLQSADIDGIKKDITVETLCMFADLQQARLAYVHYLDRMARGEPQQFKDVTGVSIHHDISLQDFWHPGDDLRHSMAYIGGATIKDYKPTDKLPVDEVFAVRFDSTPTHIQFSKKYPHPIGQQHRILYYDSLDHAMQLLLSIPSVLFHRPSVNKMDYRHPITRGWIESRSGQILAEIGAASQLVMTAPGLAYDCERPDDTVFLGLDPSLRTYMKDKDSADFLLYRLTHRVGHGGGNDFEHDTAYLLHRMEWMDHYLVNRQQQDLKQNHPYEIYHYYGYDRAPEVAPFFMRSVSHSIWDAIAIIDGQAKLGPINISVPQPFAGDAPGPTLQKAVIVESARQLPLVAASYKADLSIESLDVAADLLPRKVFADLMALGPPITDMRKPIKKESFQPPAPNFHLHRMQQRILDVPLPDNSIKRGLL